MKEDTSLEIESQLKTCSIDSLKLEDWKPEVIEEARYRYAQTVLSTKDEDTLQWAMEFMDSYERKHRIKHENNKSRIAK